MNYISVLWIFKKSLVEKQDMLYVMMEVLMGKMDKLSNEMITWRDVPNWCLKLNENVI